MPWPFRAVPRHCTWCVLRWGLVHATRLSQARTRSSPPRTARPIAAPPFDSPRSIPAGGRGLWIIEDACHAPGARWRDSHGIWHTVGDCWHSDATCLSFHPVKHFTTGEGGAVLTNRSDLYDRLVRLRSHGLPRDPAQM